jgi:mono/diheme cytochrome c family protein
VLLLGCAILVFLCCTAIFAIPQLRWRAHVLALHATGQIADIEFSELIRYMMPGSEQTLTWLIDTRCPDAVVRNYRNSPADILAGSELFLKRCAVCHARGGVGGPSLVGPKLDHGESDWAIYRTVRLGVPNTTMPRHSLPDAELWQIVGYIRSLDMSGARVRTENAVAASGGECTL